jgi:hypothetical protein
VLCPRRSRFGQQQTVNGHTSRRTNGSDRDRRGDLPSDELLTADARLARVPGITCQVEIFTA